MNLSIGIVGLPNAGKSTLFKMLTDQEVNIASYPFATIDPNVGVVEVPDERLEKLAKVGKSQKVIPAVVEFYDIAGLVRGASQGEGLGNQFLANIRQTQAIVVVLRVFRDDQVAHVEAKIDPLNDLEIINSELALKDLAVIEKRISNLESEIRGGSKLAVKEKKSLIKAVEILNSGGLLIELADESEVKNLQLLTAKKQLYLLNGEEKELSNKDIISKIKSLGGEYIIADLGDGDSIDKLISKSYETLDLISFFTVGEKEARAWTIKRGTRAPAAAGVIHSDFEKNFIRAEVVAWDRLVEAGESSGRDPWAGARSKGEVRIEGKNYEIRDGDAIIVRHG